MSVQAQWHLASAVREDADPFGKVILSAGVTVRLEGTLDELVEDWKRLIFREGRYSEQGLRCELKDGGQDCLSCPMATLDPDLPLNRLCRLGKDQRTVERRCDQLQGEKTAPFAELVESVGEYVELTEIPSDVTELLTAVGL